MTDNYLELKVPIRQNADWFVKLRDAMDAAQIPVKWQRRGTYHITMMFVKGDEQVEALNAAFDRCLYYAPAPSLTFDKVDVFKAKNSAEFIVNLTSSRPSPEFIDLVNLLLQEASNLGAEIESEFKLHVTLGKIDASTTTLNEVKKIVDGIQVPPFTLQLKDAEYRYYKGDGIGSWELDKTQPEIHTSNGNVKKIKGQWLLQISKEDENLVWIPFTDHWTTDTCILRHNGKFGIFSLPDMSDYGYFIDPVERRSLDEEPFPYDEIRISGMNGSFFGMMAYRIGRKWGASYFYYVPIKDCVDKWDVVPCRYSSMEEAVNRMFSWKNPYVEK